MFSACTEGSKSLLAPEIMGGGQERECALFDSPRSKSSRANTREMLRLLEHRHARRTHLWAQSESAGGPRGIKDESGLMCSHGKLAKTRRIRVSSCEQAKTREAKEREGDKKRETQRERMTRACQSLLCVLDVFMIGFQGKTTMALLRKTNAFPDASRTASQNADCTTGRSKPKKAFSLRRSLAFYPCERRAFLFSCPNAGAVLCRALWTLPSIQSYPLAIVLFFRSV